MPFYTKKQENRVGAKQSKIDTVNFWFCLSRKAKNAFQNEPRKLRNSKKINFGGHFNIFKVRFLKF